MSEPIRPSQQKLNELKEQKSVLVNRLSELDDLLAAGASPSDVEDIRTQYNETIAKIDKVLNVYDTVN